MLTVAYVTVSYLCLVLVKVKLKNYQRNDQNLTSHGMITCEMLLHISTFSNKNRRTKNIVCQQTDGSVTFSDYYVTSWGLKGTLSQKKQAFQRRVVSVYYKSQTRNSLKTYMVGKIAAQRSLPKKLAQNIVLVTAWCERTGFADAIAQLLYAWVSSCTHQLASFTCHIRVRTHANAG